MLELAAIPPDVRKGTLGKDLEKPMTMVSADFARLKLGPDLADLLPTSALFRII